MCFLHLTEWLNDWLTDDNNTWCRFAESLGLPNNRHSKEVLLATIDYHLHGPWCSWGQLNVPKGREYQLEVGRTNWNVCRQRSLEFLTRNVNSREAFAIKIIIFPFVLIKVLKWNLWGISLHNWMPPSIWTRRKDFHCCLVHLHILWLSHFRINSAALFLPNCSD